MDDGSASIGSNSTGLGTGPGHASASARFNDALQLLLEWLANAETYLSEDQLVLGDLDTVNVLVERHKVFQQEVTSRRDMIKTLQTSPGLDSVIRSQLMELNNVWDHIQELADVREAKLAEALMLAEQFNEAIEVVRGWLPDAEAELKFQSIPEDEDNIMQLIENHEKFQEELRGQQVNVEKIRFLAEEILQACHPNAVRFVKYYVTITQTRWEQAVSRSNQREAKLHETLRQIRTNAAMVEELMVWLADCQALLAAKEKDSIPDDLTIVETLVKEQKEFDGELSNRKDEIERLIRSLPAVTTLTKKTPRTGYGRHGDNHEVTSPAPGAIALGRKWQNVQRLSAERSKKLEEVYQRLLEVESIRNFDLDEWRQRYIAWTRANKLKYTDFFRRVDKEGTGTLTRKEFTDAILASKFPTTSAELAAVFNVLDANRTGKIYYTAFADTIMRPDKKFTPPRVDNSSRRVTDAEVVFLAIEDQMSKCQCHMQFPVERVDDSKYKFGEKGKLYQLKLLNGAVHVRFGAGFMPLEELMSTIDPCRPKNIIKPGLSSRLSGSASNLSLLGKSSMSPRLTTSPAGGGGLASQRTKSWSNLSSAGAGGGSASGSSGRMTFSLAQSPSAATTPRSKPASSSLAGTTPMNYSTSSLGRMISSRKNPSMSQSSTNISSMPFSPTSTSTSPSTATLPSRSGSASVGLSNTRHLSTQQLNQSSGSRPAAVTPSRQSVSSTSSASSSMFDLSTTSTPRSTGDAAIAQTPRSSASGHLTNGRNGRPSDAGRLGGLKVTSTATPPKSAVDISRIGARSPITVDRRASAVGGFTGSSQLERKLSAASSSTTSSSRTSSPGPSRQSAQLGNTRLFNASSDMF